MRIVLTKLALVLSLGGLLILRSEATSGPSLNGFDLSEAAVPVEAIEQGGPPRDGIPSIDRPKFLEAAEAGFLRPDDVVLGVAIDGQAKAYPVRILNWHEIVNDSLAGQPIVVTFCPLCGTGMVFDARVDGRRHEFGVSGLLYNSDVLLYDRQTESLWSQVMARAVAGPKTGQELRMLPVRHTRWRAWREAHPDALVLSTNTGAVRDYDRDPYADYARSRHTYFRVRHEAPPDYHPKEQVLGLKLDGISKAYPFIELERHGRQRFADTLGDRQIRVHWDREARSAWAVDAQGRELPGVTAFWFAWFAFHPDTRVWTAKSP